MGIARFLCRPFAYLRRSYPLRVHLVIWFSTLTLTLGLALTYFHQRATSRLLLSTNQASLQRSAHEIENHLEYLTQPIRITVHALAHKRSLQQARTLDERLDDLPFLREILDQVPMLSALYIAYENGDFFIISPIKDAPLQETPANAAYLIGSISQHTGVKRQEFLFFDHDLRLLERRPAEAYMQFDPRERSWYQMARNQNKGLITSPFYTFQASQRRGTSFAQASPQGHTIVAADLGIRALGNILAAHKLTPSSHVWLLDEEHVAIAGDREASALKTALLAAGKQSQIRVGSQIWHANRYRLHLFDAHYAELFFAVPEDELLAGVQTLRQQSLLLALLMVGGCLPLLWWQARRLCRPLERITRESAEISHFRFADTPMQSSLITEINELGQATQNAKNTIRRFLDIGLALASERDFNALLARILRESSGIMRARGGILYLRDAEAGWLTPAQALWDGQLVSDIDRIPAICEELRHYHPVLRALHQGMLSHVLEPIEFMTWFGALGVSEEHISALAISLKNRQEQTVGVLLLFEHENAGQHVSEMMALMEAISGSAALAIASHRLILEQQNLLEAFIQLIASAIDAKSPYTGGHCQRVPDLAKMLAEAACQSTSTPWTHFQLDESQWQTLHIASWLHDCGKITTPEYVVDKATKLETLYDRIHEIRMRFEVLKRDAEIQAWQAIAAGADQETTLATLCQQQATLDEEFAFVAQCNPGSEFMDPGKVARLREIAQRSWLRTLDDTLGISRNEAERKLRTPHPAPPVLEPLLADRDEHLIERGLFDYPEPEWEFNLDVPQYLYNRGELYNLSVERGTLTREERYKINEHIIQTILLLQSLPLPKHLQAVPEIACGHHEKMHGSGYPLGLRREEMSELARMMAIADIFEALTAGDRPYKPGKTLSEALGIMARLKADQHIDPDIFDLFLNSGVYLEYARRYMSAEQIDEVDIAPLLAIRPREAG